MISDVMTLVPVADEVSEQSSPEPSLTVAQAVRVACTSSAIADELIVVNTQLSQIKTRARELNAELQ